MANIVLSIITVTYNCADQIESTFKSVIPLLSNSVEFIVIDGDSEDGTKDIINKYRKYISCYVSEKDNGIYDAMNKGIMKAKGNWCIFINSGDKMLNVPSCLFDPTFLKYTAIACCVDTECSLIRPTYDWRLILHNTIPHQGLFYNIRKKKIKFNVKYKVFSDYDLNLQFLKNNQPIICLNEVVAYHSLIGVSNSTCAARKELFKPLREHYGSVCVAISFIYRKICALKYHIYHG